MRTGPDKADRAQKNEVKLRNLIETPLTDESTYFCYSWVIFEFKKRRTFTFVSVFFEELWVEPERVGILHHAAEFEKGEFTTALSDASSREEDWSWVFDDDGECDDGLEGECDDDEDDGRDNVENTFIDCAPAVEGSFWDFDDGLVGKGVNDGLESTAGKDVGAVEECEMFNVGKRFDCGDVGTGCVGIGENDGVESVFFFEFEKAPAAFIGELSNVTNDDIAGTWIFFEIALELVCAFCLSDDGDGLDADAILTERTLKETEEDAEDEDEENGENPGGKNDKAGVEEGTREEGDRENDGDTRRNASDDARHFCCKASLVNGVEAGECEDGHGDECHRENDLEVLIEG